MHSENNELAKAGHELAKCLDSNTPLTEIAKLITRLATALDVTTLAVREATKQRDALAAENAALKSCAEFYNVGFSPVKGTFGLEWKPTQKLLDDCGNIASDALKTPATDAFLREVRAQGVEMFAAAQRELANKYPGSTSYAYRSDIAVVAAVFADQLRKGGAA